MQDGSDSYVLATWLFLRLLGLTYAVAFLSLAPQLQGLVGSRGILPVKEALRRGETGRWRAFCQRPTLCWWNTRDRFLTLQCWAGAVLAAALTIGIAPVPLVLGLWALYLSLVNACGVFLAYQWDALLLEAGCLAVLLAPPVGWALAPGHAPPPFAHGLALWLLFRLLFSSGMVKWLSGDPAWRQLTALRYHYETQPLPTWIGWYAHQLPGWFQALSALVMFAVELVVPFGLLFPPTREMAALVIFGFMGLILLTGNYAFFNLLTIALALLAFDDATLQPLLRGLLPATLPSPPDVPFWWLAGEAVAGSVLMALTLPPMAGLVSSPFRTARWLAPFSQMFLRVAPFHLVNSYGLFAVMTTSRPELIVEGSRDARTWQPYAFRWKPGDVTRAPRFVAPHQPRLDWQLWFAALGSYPSHPWVLAFLGRLLEGSPPVLRLLARNPFPDEPPLYVRAVVYTYRFTSLGERWRTGSWWRREPEGLYCPLIAREMAEGGNGR